MDRFGKSDKLGTETMGQSTRGLGKGVECKLGLGYKPALDCKPVLDCRLADDKQDPDYKDSGCMGLDCKDLDYKLGLGEGQDCKQDLDKMDRDCKVQDYKQDQDEDLGCKPGLEDQGYKPDPDHHRGQLDFHKLDPALRRGLGLKLSTLKCKWSQH
jgi:hypothetical protein